MSSTSYSANLYSATLTPDPWLRIVILSAGRVLIAVGLVVVLTLPLGVGVRATGSLLWLLLGAWELRSLQRGFGHCRSIRLRSDGRIQILSGENDWSVVTLLSGSIVLTNLAWLRLRLDNGTDVFELLQGNARESHDWRRFQVIWQHIGAAR